MVIGYFAYSNYSMRGEVARLKVQVADLEAEVSAKENAVHQVERGKDAEIARLHREMQREKERGISEEALKAKDQEIAELKRSLEKARDFMRKQKEEINWHKAQLRKSQEMLQRGR